MRVPLHEIRRSEPALKNPRPDRTPPASPEKTGFPVPGRGSAAGGGTIGWASRSRRQAVREDPRGEPCRVRTAGRFTSAPTDFPFPKNLPASIHLAPPSNRRPRPRRQCVFRRGGAGMVYPVRFPSPVGGPPCENEVHRMETQATGEDHGRGHLHPHRRAERRSGPWGVRRRFSVGATFPGVMDRVVMGRAAVEGGLGVGGLAARGRESGGRGDKIEHPRRTAGGAGGLSGPELPADPG